MRVRATDMTGEPVAGLVDPTVDEPMSFFIRHYGLERYHGILEDSLVRKVLIAAALLLPVLVLVAMLAGAMRELRIGDPASFSTDIGPTVSAIIAHIEAREDTLIDLRVERPSLEDRFLEITTANDHSTGGVQ